jgi:hypothetical protein
MSSRARDVYNGVTATNLIAPQTAAAAVQSAAIDTTQMDGELGVLMEVATGGTGTLNANLINCATETGTYTELTDVDFTAVTTAVSTQYVGVDKNSCKKYIKMNIDPGTSHDVSATLFSKNQVI